MYRFKRPKKKTIIFEIILIFALNTLVWFLFVEKYSVESLCEFAGSYIDYQLKPLIPLFFMLLFSLFCYAVFRWRESAKCAVHVERRISKDVLTKLYNRRSFESKLLVEWMRFTRYHESFCLILVDIDDFKLINDNFGHQEGDRIIIEVSEKLLRNIRKTDFCARWSGAEFLILCPVSELPLIVELAERLRADVYRLLKEGIELSISVGVTQVDDHKSVDELLKNVELQLYNAKKNGGNGVVSV